MSEDSMFWIGLPAVPDKEPRRVGVLEHIGSVPRAIAATRKGSDAAANEDALLVDSFLIGQGKATAAVAQVVSSASWISLLGAVVGDAKLPHFGPEGEVRFLSETHRDKLGSGFCAPQAGRSGRGSCSPGLEIPWPRSRGERQRLDDASLVVLKW